MAEVKYVQPGDRDFWFLLDRHLPQTEFEEKVRRKRGYVLWENGRAVGLLRYNLFWDNTPFCTMLYIAPEFQGRGYGRILMEHWEAEMKKKGYGMLLTSTQVDEKAQHFYRKLGYKDCGGLVIDLPGEKQPMELFLIKEIRPAQG